MGASTDIDIDFPDRYKALRNIPHVAAAMVQRGERVRHMSGIYFQDIPVDPTDGLAVPDYIEAADQGYFKIDFLANYIYEGVRDEAHMDALLAREPLWDLLEDEEIVGSLAHIRDHFDTVLTIRPRSIMDLAVCLAIMRPGKRHLIGRPRHEIDAEIWLPVQAYHYKKSHSVAYAASIVVQLNLLVEQANEPVAEVLV
jgi:hypothetical protein